MKRVFTAGLLTLLTLSLSAADKLTLEQCIQAAIENNKTLQMGEIGVRQANLDTKSKYSNLYPSVGASAGESGGNGGTKLGTSANLNQKIYSPGLYSEIKLAKNQTDITRLNQDELIAQIRTAVETAFYNILTSQGLLNVYRENITTSDENLRMIQTMFKLGTRTESDVLQAEVQKGEIENKLISQELELVNEKRSLAVLMGTSPDQDFEIEEADVEQIAVPTLAEARELLFKNNREYQSLQKSLKSEQLSLKITRESYFPTISAGYGYSKNWTGATAGNGSGSWNLSASVGLFNGFSKKQAVQKSQLSLKSAEVELSAKEQELLGTLLTYYSNLDNYNKVIVLQEKTLESARKNYELIARQYELGMATLLQQTTAQVSVLEAQTNLVKAKYSRKIVESQIKQLLAI
jgi:outer membrane protein